MLEMRLPLFHQLNGGLISEAIVFNSMHRSFLSISHYGVCDDPNGPKSGKSAGGIQMDTRQ